MTTVAANLKSMASDTFSSTSVVGYQVSKMIQIGDCIIGCAGVGHKCETFLKWFNHGGRPPVFSNTDRFEALLLDRTGLYVFHNDLVRERLFKGYHAIGSGQQYAIGALSANASPKRAVAIAAMHDPYSKPPIDTYVL